VSDQNWPERLIDLPGEQKWHWFRLDHDRFAAQVARERREAAGRCHPLRDALRGAQRLWETAVRRFWR